MIRRLGALLGVVLALTVSGAAAPAAHAGELMLGGFAHDLGPADRERDSFDVQLGYRTERLTYGWSKYILHPQVHALLSFNNKYSTDFVAAGFDWKVPILRTPFYIRPGIGIAYTTGKYDLPPANAPDLSPSELERRLHLYRGRIDFGDPVLFEPELAAGYKISDQWLTELSWTHLSNGQILHQGKNEGLDDVGLRVVYKFH